MLIRIIHVTEERRPEDAQGEQEAEGEAEEDGGEDGVGDDHRVHVPAPTLLLEFSAIRGIVLKHPSLDGGGDGEHHGDQDDAEADGDVDLALPLHLGRDPRELQGDVDGEGHQAEWREQVVEGKVICVEPVRRLLQ